MKRTALLLTCFFAVINTFAQQLRIATYQYADNNRLGNIKPFADYLRSAYGISTSVKSYPTVHAFIDAIRNDEADIALINTFGYFLLESSLKPYPMDPLLTLEVDEKAKDNYKTAFLVSPSSEIKNLADIKNAAATTRLALVAKGSTSGNMLPRLALSYTGVPDAERLFLSVRYAGTHAKAIDAILHEEADLATTGLTEYQRYLSRDSSFAGKLRLIWTSPEIPLGPVLLNKKIGQEQVELITTAFLELHEKNTPALEAIKTGWSEAKQANKYIRIDDSFYDPFRKILGRREDLERILKQFAE